MNPLFVCVLVFAVSFLLGSIPSGMIIGKLFYGVDIRDIGSGNIGTTNAIRALGKKGGYAVFLLDFGKGLLAGFIAHAVFVYLLGVYGTQIHPVNGDFLGAAFLGCVLGHIFSPWLRFKGGKGIAVAIGCLFFTYGPLLAMLELAVFAVVVVVSKYVSAGSLVAAALCSILAFLVYANDIPAALMCTAVGIVVIWAHRGNIARLRAGTEHKIGQGSKEAS